MSKPMLLCMLGLPRSGKSTICERLSKQLGAPIVRRDAIRLALHGQRYEAQAEPMVKAMSLYMIRALFLANHDVVLCDETNFSHAARDSLRDPKWETVFYPVLTDRDTCIERAIDTQQPDLAPVIDSMWRRYESPNHTDIIVTDITENGTIVTQVVGDKDLEIPLTKE